MFPKLHTGSTTESTIEFYGTYGTGRIPTIQKLQIEAGNKATAWSPSPRDTQSSLNANAEAIKLTQAEVKKHGDSLSSQSLDISKLRNDLTITNTEVSKKRQLKHYKLQIHKLLNKLVRLKLLLNRLILYLQILTSPHRLVRTC